MALHWDTPAPPPSWFITIANLKAGYPPNEIVNMLEQKYILSHLLKMLCTFPYNKDSRYTEKELLHISDKQKQMPAKLPIAINDYHTEVYNITGVQDMRKNTTELLSEVLLLLLHVSYYYKRPRPNMLSQFYNIPVAPVMSQWLLLPSYPNPFIVGAKLLMKIAADPNEKSKLEKASQRFVAAGWHYPSDNMAAYAAADIIFADNHFKEKFVKL